MNRVGLYLFLTVTLFNMSELTVCAQETEEEVVVRLFEEIDFKSIYYPKKAQEQFDSLLYVSSLNFQKKYKGYFDFIRAQVLYNNMRLDSSLVCVESSISFFANKQKKEWLSRSQYLLGKIAETTRLYEQAKINYYEAIGIDDSDNNRTGSAYIGIARCKMVLSESFQAEMETGLKLLRKENVLEAVFYADLMEQYFSLDSNNAPFKLKELAGKYIVHKSYNRAVNVYKLIASSYNAKENIDSAHVYCDKAIDLSDREDVGRLVLPALYQFKGVLYYKQEKYNIADVYFKRSLELYKRNGQSNRMMYTYDYLHRIDVAKDNYRNAYFNLQEYIDLVEKTTSSEKVRIAKVLEINNKIDLMKGQLAQLETEKRASEFMLYLVLVIATVILAGVGVYIYLYQKGRKAKIAELNKEFHNLLIGIGEKQLLEYRLNNEQSEDVEEKDVPKADAKIMPEVEGVRPFWDVEEEELGDSFDSCYMETINLFKRSFPQLTRTEVRYAVMICLRLPMEVIAKVQNVQSPSIRKAKQRIRVKLNVVDSLEDYLQEFRERQISNLAAENAEHK